MCWCFFFFHSFFRFACDDLEILVKSNDKINFVCPHKALNQGELVNPARSSNLYENAHILQPEQRKNFYMCDATGLYI